MKKHIFFTIICCLLLPVAAYILPNLASSIIGCVLIILLTVLLGFKWGIIAATWGSMVAFISCNWDMYNYNMYYDLYAVVIIYFLIALGVGKTLDKLKREIDKLKENEIDLNNKISELINKKERESRQEEKRLIKKEKKLLRDIEMLKEEVKSLKYLNSEIAFEVAEKISIPLNNILNYANEKSDINVYVLSNQLQNLSCQINNLKEYYSIKHNNVIINTGEFDTRQAIENLIRRYSLNLENKHIQFICYIKSTVPYFLKGDKEKLIQILDNIVNNSLEYTEKGDITVIGEEISNDGHNSTIKFFISDTGIGIEENMLDKIFEMPEHFESGKGISLPISKKLVEAMGGNMGVISRKGYGSIFSFSIPFAKSIKNDRESQQYFKYLNNIKVLVIEDNELNCTIMEEILTIWGARVTITRTEAETLSKIKENEFEVIIIDSQLNNMDFIRMIEILEQNGENMQNVIMLLEDKDKDKFEKVGLNNFVLKPIIQQELNSSIVKMINNIKLLNSNKTA